MKHLLPIFFFLGSSLFAHAQNVPKNEFSLGYFSVGEFFDTTRLSVSKFNSGKSISLKYTRSIAKKLSLALTYSRCSFEYGLPLYPSGEPLYPRTIVYRFQRTLTADFGVTLSKKALLIRAKSGIRYNQFTEKSVHLAGGWHSGGWYESFGTIDDYGKVGASMGISIAHPIFWRIFGELDSEFAKMFSGVDRNQLLLSYRIGIRF
ncbi:MAG: hypothetical protein Q7U74_07015 [Saprospiraceae bacterium]|nr:hypothetical protein [Saprospiraceae bacterium]